MTKGMVTLATETTTMPEGATVSVVRANTKTGAVNTYLIAAHGKKEIQMKVDDISPGSMPQYLKMMCREIDKLRALIEKKPEFEYYGPNTIRSFVHNMAYHGMFIFDTLTDANSTGNPAIPKTRKSTSNKRKRQNHPANLRRNAGDAEGTE